VVNFLDCLQALKQSWKKISTATSSWRRVERQLERLKPITVDLYRIFEGYSADYLLPVLYYWFIFGDQTRLFVNFPFTFVQYHQLDIPKILDEAIAEYQSGTLQPNFKDLAIWLCTKFFNTPVPLEADHFQLLKHILEPKKSSYLNIYESWAKQFNQEKIVANLDKYYQYFANEFNITHALQVDYGQLGFYVLGFRRLDGEDIPITPYDLCNFKNMSVRLVPRNISSYSNFDVLRARLRQRTPPIQNFLMTKRIMYQNVAYFDGKSWCNFSDLPHEDPVLQAWIPSLEQSESNIRDYYLKPTLCKNHKIYDEVQNPNLDNPTHYLRFFTLLETVDALKYSFVKEKIQEKIVADRKKRQGTNNSAISIKTINDRLRFIKKENVANVIPSYYHKLGLGTPRLFFAYSSNSRKRRQFLHHIYRYIPQAIIYTSVEGVLFIIAYLPKQWAANVTQKLENLQLDEFNVVESISGTWFSAVPLTPLFDPLTNEYKMSDAIKQKLLYLTP